MICNCGERAVYKQRTSGKHLCSNCLTEQIDRKVTETINQNRMIQRGDRVGVGISGGKDSTVLLTILRKIDKKLGFTLHPIIIDEGIDNYRESGLRSASETCENLNLSLEIRSFQAEQDTTLDEISYDRDVKPCAYCGIYRRGILNKTALERKLDKIAVGHNLDDEAQVILMNILQADIERLHRLKGTAQTPDLVKRIKPLYKIPEKEIMLYALVNNLNISQDECPYAKTNHRTQIREFINQQEKERPGTKHSIIRSWEKITKTTIKKGKKVSKCSVCGDPTARKICRKCELTKQIKIKTS